MRMSDGSSDVCSSDLAASVARETKRQVKDLYSQTQRELKEQAAVQQQRVAEGLRSVGDELGSMAEKFETPGVAADLVSQVSSRLGGAATWIADRDPGSRLEGRRGGQRCVITCCYR